MKKENKKYKVKNAVSAYNDTGNKTDPMGMYTGNPVSERDSISSEQYRPYDEKTMDYSQPTQDVDDL